MKHKEYERCYAKAGIVYRQMKIIYMTIFRVNVNVCIKERRVTIATMISIN